MTKQKIALFQRVGDSQWKTVWNCPVTRPDKEADANVPSGYVRLSPWIEVDFPELDNDTVIKSQLDQLDMAAQKAREELQQRLNAINETRQRLLALTFKPAA